MATKVQNQSITLSWPNETTKPYTNEDITQNNQVTLTETHALEGKISKPELLMRHTQPLLTEKSEYSSLEERIQAIEDYITTNQEIQKIEKEAAKEFRDNGLTWRWEDLKEEFAQARPAEKILYAVLVPATVIFTGIISSHALLPLAVTSAVISCAIRLDAIKEGRSLQAYTAIALAEAGFPAEEESSV